MKKGNFFKLMARNVPEEGIISKSGVNFNNEYPLKPVSLIFRSQPYKPLFSTP